VDIRSASPTTLAADVRVRVCTLALLVAADGVFLWMFLSTDPLEQLAVAMRAPQSSRANAALAFAAAWRHGMAGNSWIYMPGFFVTAAALWLHGRHAPAALAASVERMLAALTAVGLSCAASSTGASTVVQAFEAATGAGVGSVIPAPSWIGTVVGLYTLGTWSVFVLACRAALVRRTLRSFARAFAPAAVLAVGLPFVRPWTVDDFVTHWSAGVAAGSAPAGMSLALLFIVALLLAASERSAEPQPRERLLRDREAARRHDD
jgi:hypothetical protein